MNILLTAATAKEINPFFEYYGVQKKLVDIDVLITGVGLTIATYNILKQISFKKPDFVLQVGIAGSFKKKIPLGTIVVVKKEIIADQSVMESKKLKTIFDLGLVSRNQFPFSNGWLVNKNPILKQISLEKVNAISVNEITTSKQKIKLYKKAFNPVIETMEGAALHYACLMEKIPFIQLRSVSNYIGERDKKKWKLKESIQNLNKELIKVVEFVSKSEI
jgi:futalosine hydrolase